MMERNGLEPDRQAVEAMGRELLSRIADHVEGLPKAPVSRFGGAGDAVARMLLPPPETPGTFHWLLDDFQEAASYGLDPSHSGYLAYFPAGGLVSSALADALAQVFNRFTTVADLAPALVAMENGVLRWLAGLFDLPEGAGGLVTTGGSAATLTAVVAARHDRLGEDLTGARLYVTEHTHYCVAKSARIAGLPASAVRIVPTRGLRMDPAAAARMIEEDRALGLRPFLLAATAGTTSTGTVDPLPELGELAAREGLWFHVDAAYGGGLRLTERGRARLAGIGRADSVVVDPHKSLFLPYGTGVLLARDPGTLSAAHADSGDYLQDRRAVGGLPDFHHYGVELTREFRGLRLWLPLHLHGVAAFRAALDEKLDLAALVHRELAADPLFEVPWEPDLTVVVFRPRGDDAAGRELLERVNAGERIFLSSTVVEGRFFLRINPTSHRTHAAETRAALEIIRGCARAVTG
ncbi:pyridoxal phosphate-dependent decarboxylase family protein [Nonomuraea jiangxiensis]|uniref:Aromatic-L-amino-acid decarboxylase n=1 Tax=Nonomuraea jiangxiensis TaxID=633440 RepID=A0A1G9DLG7_9ACTN|nr:aminotransferase class V-fold PLP-dependent enzyme [Nonomuraea jiangxiensis]SDK64692.1 aromatic-L-amino-acid decarboxylase [Nonomuraea jiangxiensis]